MTWVKTRNYSLADTAGKWPVDWFLIYSDMQDQKHWLAKVLRPGFQHVRALRRDGQVWVLVDPNYSFVEVQLVRTDHTPWQFFPGATVQYVSTLRTAKQNNPVFHVGPLSCVDAIKALLGIRRWSIMTPWQLFQHCKVLPCPP